MTDSTAPIVSVVVPAHDEGPQIARTLEVLLADARPGEFEVVVVANGCSDDTASIARGFTGIRVEERAEPSKVRALAHGDRVATTFPRIYLDGDVELSPDTARAIVAALNTDEPRIAGVVGHLHTNGSTRPARWYYDFRQRLPVFHRGIIGAGVYAMNSAGRARFDTWPDVLGDDQFVLRQFAEHERTTVAGHQTRVVVTEDLPTVIRRQVRVRRGNAQLTTGGSTHDALPPPAAGIGTALREAASRPSAWPGALTWVAVQAVVRARVRWQSGGGDWVGQDADS